MWPHMRAVMAGLSRANEGNPIQPVLLAHAEMLVSSFS